MVRYIFIGIQILFIEFCNAQSWTPLSVGSTSAVMRVSFPTDDTGYVSLDNGTMRKTTNSATNWTPCTAPMNFVTPLAFVSGTKGFSAGLYGIKMTTDGAATWNYVQYDSLNFPVDFCAVNSTLIYAAYTDQSGTSLYLHKSTDGGTTWNLMPITTMVVSTGDLLFINSDTGYVTAADCIFKTVDGGMTWDTSYFDINGDMVTYLGSNDGVNIYAATQSLQFLVSTDGGVSWNPVGSGNPLPAYGISFVTSLTGFVCGGDGISSGYIDYTNDGGLTWTNVYIGNTLWCMDFPSASRGYAAGTNGVIVRYDGGPQSTSENCVSQIQVYPNPATDFITIENAEIGSVITITNNLGQVVRSEVATDSRMRIDVAGFAEGIYFTVIPMAAGSQTVRTIIQ